LKRYVSKKEICHCEKLRLRCGRSDEAIFEALCSCRGRRCPTASGNQPHKVGYVAARAEGGDTPPLAATEQNDFTTIEIKT